MNLLGFIGQIFTPATELIDSLHTSEGEKLAAKAAILEVQVGFLQKAVDYETAQLEAKSRIIEAEAKSASWITANWRPITMLTFLALVVLDQTGLLAFRLADQAWTLLQIGLGGYVTGRSLEKITPVVVSALKKKEDV